jgi:catechol 2,3-dioxygenase-like lactoylglutathione lyase family enzyme
VGKWYSRPLLFVGDIDRASRFYVTQLGFTETWRHAEDGKPLIAQVERDGCELILSSQWPERPSNGIIFISLEGKDVNSIRAGFEAEGVSVKEGWWGYPLMIVEDPDGNELWVPTNNAG